jgi:hypothetical protein
MTEPRARVRNAADPEQVKGARRAERDQAEVERQDMLVLLGIPEARRYLWRLMAFCHVFETVWPGTMADFENGERNVGLRVLTEITDAQPDALIKMMVEAKADEMAELDYAASKRRKKEPDEETEE